MKNQNTKNKSLMKIVLRLVIMSVFALTFYSFFHTNQVSAQQSYQLLAPLPNFGEVYTPGNLGKYVENIIKLSITVAAVLAVLMIVIGGFKYMGSEQMGVKTEGKEQMKNAILGLIILSASFLILNTINPALLNFNLTIEGVQTGTAPTTGTSQTFTPADTTTYQQQNAAAIGGSVLFSGTVPSPGRTGRAEAINSFNASCQGQGGTPQPSVNSQTIIECFKAN